VSVVRAMKRQEYSVPAQVPAAPAMQPAAKVTQTF
jgi:hypothetical protein